MRATIAAFAALPVLLGLAGPAAATALRVEYRLTLAGFTLGQAELAGTFAGERYDLQMKAQLTGIAGLFTSSGQGGASASGAVSGSRIVSSGFTASARTGSSERTVRMALGSGNAGTVEIEPPFELRPDRVPLTESDRRNVVDPMSAVMAIAANRARPDDASNCNHTLPVFDGTQRFDVVLSYAETKAVTKPGFSGNVIVCNARYRAVAGHRPQRWAVKFMEENRDMSVWLAPVEGTRLLVPLRIAIRTYYGMSVVEAEKWSVE